MKKRRGPPARLAQGVIAGGWLAVCLVASYVVMQYDFSAGRLGQGTGRWPSDATLTPGPTTTVVAFLHPRCPCTKATVKHLVKTLKSSPEVHLVADMFVLPGGSQAPEWRDNAYVRAIRKELPTAEVVFDPEAVEAARFGALTSGTVLVFDAWGIERFRGGITDRRGGERDNPGLSQLAKVVTPGSQGQPMRPTPVFGCPLVLAREPAR